MLSPSTVISAFDQYAHLSWVDALVRANPELRTWVHWYNNQWLLHRLGLRPPAEADADYRNGQL